MKGFALGLIVGVLILAGGVYGYFAMGIAPAAASDKPMPFEDSIARKSLRAHIQRETIPSPSIQPDEGNLLAGAKVYQDQCAVCHGLPDQPPPPIANGMFPHAPLLFKGRGVTNNDPTVIYWKVTNGIRLTGMPGFKAALNDTQLWQVTLMLKHAHDIPDSVKKVLAPVKTAADMPAPAMPASKTMPAPKGKG